MAGIVGGLIVVYVLILLLPIIAVCLSLPYIALRIRDSREEKKDPRLGIKAAYYFLLSTSILLILFGLTVAAIDVMDGSFEKKNQQAQQAPVFGKDVDKEVKERMQRVAWGLVISGVLFTLLFMILIKSGTNDTEFPAPKRLFVGGRLALAGVVNMIAITILIILILQKDLKDNSPYEVITGVSIVWFPTLAIHIFLMWYYGAQGYHIEKPDRHSRHRDRDDDDDYDD